MSTKLIVKFHSAFPARIAHPAVAEFGAGVGRLEHGLDQQVADDSSLSSQSHREVVAGDRAAEQRSRRADQGLRRPYPGCGAQFGCVIA